MISIEAQATFKSIQTEYPDAEIVQTLRDGDVILYEVEADCGQRSYFIDEMGDITDETHSYLLIPDRINDLQQERNKIIASLEEALKTFNNRPTFHIKGWISQTEILFLLDNDTHAKAYGYLASYTRIHEIQGEIFQLTAVQNMEVKRG